MKGAAISGAKTQTFGVPSQDLTARARLRLRRAGGFWPALIQIERQSGTMGRENLLFWLSIAWLVLLCGGVVWALVAL